MNIVCKNCETHFEGKFCPQCAQKASAGRLQVGNVLHEFWHNFTHTDHSVFSFVKDMFVKPGLVIRDFIEGKRKKYFNPYTFFLLSTGILIFITSRLFEYEDSLFEVKNEFGQYVSKHYNIILICCLPFVALIMRVAFSKHKYNYAEWITFFVFTFGFINFIQIFIQCLYFFFIKYHFQFNKYTTMLAYVIFVYTLISFLKPKKITEIIASFCGGILVYWFIERVGSAVALWFWGMPFENAVKGINLF
jgi:Protein of unknown function (DUF3667)